MCAYLGVKNKSFSEKNVINELFIWGLDLHLKKDFICFLKLKRKYFQTVEYQFNLVAYKLEYFLEGY